MASSARAIRPTVRPRKTRRHRGGSSPSPSVCPVASCGTVRAMEQGLPAPVARKLNPVGRFGIRTTLLGAALLLVAIPFGFLLEQVTSGGPATRYDASAAQWLNDRLH